MKCAIASYFCICSAVGAAMGSRGFPLFNDFFYPPLWQLSLAFTAVGVVLFEISKAQA